MAIVRRLYPAAKTFQPYLVDVVGNVAIGATGAVGAATGRGFTVTRTGTGLYTVTLDANVSVPAIIHCDAMIVNSSGAACFDAYVLTLNAGAKTAADPPNGSFLTFRIVVQNSQVNQ
jgi:hypothetical protein